MKYIGYYDVDTNEENRNVVLSAKTKMDYIIQVLCKTGNKKDRLQVISASGTKNKKGCSRRTVALSENASLQLLSDIGTGNKVKRVLQKVLFDIEFFLYLFDTISREEVVVVYHSLGYASLIRLLKTMKKFKLILEVEELYSDVTGDLKVKAKELKLAKAADAFIFSTERMEEKLNPHKKPSVIAHGTYQVQENRICKTQYRKMHDWEESKIHVVYAGTLDPRKGGAIAAVTAARYLPVNYHLHILGFGLQLDIRNMMDMIQKLTKICQCTITYDGLLSGDDYMAFIQACDIGLSTQDPKAAFNATSFPSKILSYMANGLCVVSIRIPVVEQSAIGGNMFYYDIQTPQAIAKAIMGVENPGAIDSREVIKKLDSVFSTELREMIKEVARV